MKKLWKWLSCFVFVFLLTVLCHTQTAMAATATFQVSNASVTQGSLVSVTVTVSSDQAMQGYQCAVTYDTNLLEWISDSNMGGGGGRITVVEYNVDGKKSHSFTLQFRGLKPGSASVAIEKSSFLMAYDSNLNDLTPSAGKGTVTVKAPVQASTNNKLRAMTVYGITDEGGTVSVTLSPSFSPDTLEYKVSVDHNVASYAIEASTADPKASTWMKGLELAVGSNETYVVVTAEDGSKRNYHIVTEKAAPPPVDNSMLELELDGVPSLINREFDKELLPSGFEMGQFTYAEQKIACANNVNRSLMLFYITQADGEVGRFYIYNRLDGTFMPFRQLSGGKKLLTILQKDPEEIPYGFEMQTVTIGKESYEMLRKGNYCLFYGMNERGSASWYLYEITEGTIQLVKMDLFEEPETTEPEPEPETIATDTDAEKWAEKYKSLQETRKQEKMVSTIMVVVFGCLSILFLVIMLSVVIKYKKQEEAEILTAELSEQELQMINDILETPYEETADDGEKSGEPEETADDGEKSGEPENNAGDEINS